MAKVSYSLGRTVNQGNYNSARVDVSHEIECAEHEVEEKFALVKAFVQKKLREALEDLS